MSDFEGVKRNAAQTFSNVVRASSVADKLNPQQMMLVMSTLLDPLEPGQALDLTQLGDFLRSEHNLSPQEIEEIFVFFQSREDKLGLSVVLPISMHNLPEARRTKIIERFNKKPSQATYSGQSSKEAPSPGQPSRAETQFEKKAPAAAGANQRRKMIAAGVFIVVGGFFAYQSIANRPKGPEVVVLEDTKNAFSCVDLKVSGTSVYCTIARDEVEKLPEAERKTRAEATLNLVKVKSPKVDRLVLRDTTKDHLRIRF